MGVWGDGRCATHLRSSLMSEWVFWIVGARAWPSKSPTSNLLLMQRIICPLAPQLDEAAKSSLVFFMLCSACRCASHISLAVNCQVRGMPVRVSGGREREVDKG